MTVLRAGTFELLREVGEGGFGTVYEARDQRDGRTAAVKVLHATDENAERRFEREVALLAGLDHPNVVRYLDHGRTPHDQAYLAMEWLEGETLAARLERTRLSVGETLLLARGVVAGLIQAEALGIVHRDLKPANLFLVSNDVAQTKILDFGLARRIGDGAALTGMGVALGTPHYMSPEQARGEQSLNLASDVFALGSVLYECLAGVRPFEGNHPCDSLVKICTEEPRRLEQVSPGLPLSLGRLVHAMLSKTPGNRPSLHAIERELHALDPAKLTAVPDRDVAAHLPPGQLPLFPGQSARSLPTRPARPFQRRAAAR